MDPILAQGDGIDTNINSSIAALDKFLESQTSSLRRLRDGIAVIEELKQQTIDQPGAVLNDILGGVGRCFTQYSYTDLLGKGRDELKFSQASMELDVELPGIDWSLVSIADGEFAGSTRIETSRVGRLKGHITELRNALAALSPLPASLLDNEEEKARKRRRVDSTGPPLRPTTSSSTLRLPYLATQYDTTIITSSDTTPHPQQPSFTSTSSPITNHLHDIGSATMPSNVVSQVCVDRPHPEMRPWASKSASTTDPTPTHTSSPPSPVVHKLESIEIKGDSEMMDSVEQDQGPSTFKQNWTLAEQHMLERLLTEIPSTVKFRWVRISEAMGGTRTPRQVASRVQKYYQKMKKLGVAVDSADMGGGGRGGSKATQELDMPGITRGRGSSTRGKPKTGPQYTKSGRRR